MKPSGHHHFYHLYGRNLCSLVSMFGSLFFCLLLNQGVIIYNPLVIQETWIT